MLIQYCTVHEMHSRDLGQDSTRPCGVMRQSSHENKSVIFVSMHEGVKIENNDEIKG